MNALGNEVVILRKENAKLRERLAFYESPKKSNNSFIPLSNDENRPRRNQTLRKSLEKAKKSLGWKRKTLEMSKNPDEVTELVPEYYSACGNSLEGMAQRGMKARQVGDVTIPKAIVTQYRRFTKTCRCRVTFPAGETSL